MDVTIRSISSIHSYHFLKGDVTDFEVSLRTYGNPMGIHNPQKNPGAVTGFPENSFISAWEPQIRLTFGKSQIGLTFSLIIFTSKRATSPFNSGFTTSKKCTDMRQLHQAGFEGGTFSAITVRLQLTDTYF